MVQGMQVRSRIIRSRNAVKPVGYDSLEPAGLTMWPVDGSLIAMHPFQSFAALTITPSVHLHPLTLTHRGTLHIHKLKKHLLGKHTS